VIAMLRCSAGTPKDSAIDGRAVLSAVESTCSMKMALARISAMVRGLAGNIAGALDGWVGMKPI
jgi:hypothetical protein